MKSNKPIARAASMLIALVAVTAFFAWKEPAFLTARNLNQLAIELSMTAVLALGMLLIILPGHIDLSVGSGLALAGGIAAVLTVRQDWPAWAALLTAAAGSVLVYAILGLIIVSQRMPAFIITLGGLLAFRGLHWMVIETRTVPVAPGGTSNVYEMLTTYHLAPAAGWTLAGIIAVVLLVHALRAPHNAWRWAATVVGVGAIMLAVWVADRDKGLPLPAVILAAVAMAIYVLTNHTPFGRYLYAIGGNEEAAKLSGVPVALVSIGAFAINGAIVALSGFMHTAFQGSSSPTLGEWAELYAIAACVIGGASLKGGRGTVMGVIFGALIMAELLVGMRLMGARPESRLIASGVVLALAVWLDVRLSRRGESA